MGTINKKVPRRRDLSNNRLMEAQLKLTLLWLERKLFYITSLPTGVLPADSSLQCRRISTERLRIRMLRLCSSPRTGQPRTCSAHEGESRGLARHGARVGVDQESEGEVWYLRNTNTDRGQG